MPLVEGFNVSLLLLARSIKAKYMKANHAKSNIFAAYIRSNLCLCENSTNQPVVLYEPAYQIITALGEHHFFSFIVRLSSRHFFHCDDEGGPLHNKSSCNMKPHWWLAAIKELHNLCVVQNYNILLGLVYYAGFAYTAIN